MSASCCERTARTWRSSMRARWSSSPRSASSARPPGDPAGPAGRRPLGHRVRPAARVRRERLPRARHAGARRAQRDPPRLARTAVSPRAVALGRRSVAGGQPADTARGRSAPAAAAGPHATPRSPSRCSVGVETVRTHARNIYRKLGVSSRRELVAATPRERRESGSAGLDRHGAAVSRGHSARGARIGTAP